MYILILKNDKCVPRSTFTVKIHTCKLKVNPLNKFCTFISVCNAYKEEEVVNIFWASLSCNNNDFIFLLILGIPIKSGLLTPLAYFVLVFNTLELNVIVSRMLLFIFIFSQCRHKDKC